MEKKSYKLKEGREGAQISVSLADRNEQLVVKSWPFETEQVDEQAALDAHPWVVADDSGSGGPGDKPVSKMNKNELIAEAEKRGLDVNSDMTKAQIFEAIKIADDTDDEHGANAGSGDSDGLPDETPPDETPPKENSDAGGEA